MKKIYAVIIAAAMLLSFCLGVGASNGLEEINALLNRGITIKMDGQAQEMYDANGERVYPISYNGTTYLPVRAVSNMLGLGVMWDEASNSVLLTSGGAVSTSKTLAAGTAEGTSYRNQSLGIGFTLPEGWVFATDEEKQSLMGTTGTMLGEDFGKAIATSGAYMDMMAISPDGSSATIIIEKKPEEAKTMDFGSVIDGAIEFTKQQLDGLYDKITFSPKTFQVGSDYYQGYEIDGEIMGVQTYQYTIMIDLGDYIATVGVTTLGDNVKAESLWNNFFSL